MAKNKVLSCDPETKTMRTGKIVLKTSYFGTVVTWKLWAFGYYYQNRTSPGRRYTYIAFGPCRFCFETKPVFKETFDEKAKD